MNIGTMFSKIGFWGRKHSPELLVVGGILSTAASVALAVYSTTKLDKILAPYNKKIDSIKSDLKNDNKIQNHEVDIKKSKKELAITYGHAVLKVGALYTPSILFFASSVGCILGSHKIMKSRNLALTAACATLERSYKAYRDRVKDKLGEEAENKLYKDVYKEEKEIIDPVTGKSKTKKIDVPHVKKDHDWNVMYDCGNYGWQPYAIRNFEFLMERQDYLNTKLQRQGYLFLEDVYETLGYTTAMLGKRKALASRILGWLYKPEDPTRDSYVSFGITHPGTRTPLPEIQKQIENNEAGFWLSLNPDGDILNDKNGVNFADYAKDCG